MNRRDVVVAGLATVALAGLSNPAHSQPQGNPQRGASDPFALPPLPYALDALQPHISRETLEFHHGKHHKAYLDNLRPLVPETRRLNLQALITNPNLRGGATYNNAAQAWNHQFFWNSMRPNGGGEPKGKLADAIKAKFGTFDAFKTAFGKAALSNFGSGWTWLVKTREGIDVINTSNADTPLTLDDTVPLLTLDVWEHAYYIDYRNARAKFIEAYLNALVNWEFAESNYNT